MSAKLGNTDPTAISRATRILIISREKDLFAKLYSKPSETRSASSESGQGASDCENRHS